MLSNNEDSGSPDGCMSSTATDNQRIVDLFGNFFHKADATHSVSNLIHNGMVAFYRSLPRVFNIPEDNIFIAGSYREGVKISNENDLGDIDVVFDGKVIDVKEDFFIYNEKFPCFCKVVVDNELMDASELLPWYADQSEKSQAYLYEDEVAPEYREDGGIQGGYLVENWADNIPKLFYCVRFYLKVFKEIKRTTEGFTPQNSKIIVNEMLKKESERENARQNYKWQDDTTLIKWLIHVFWLMICSGKSEQELENDFTTYLKQVLFSDDTESELSLVFDIVDILRVIGSEASESDIDKLKTDLLRSFSNSVPICQTMISKLKIPAVDHICSCRVDGWPQTARLWIDRTPRNWPEKNTIDYVISQGFNLVGKPPPEGGDENQGTDFYLSFSRAEQLLCDDLTTIQKNTFLILKAMMKFGKGFYVVKTYYLKTILFWALEETEAEDWKEENIHKNLSLLIDRLIVCFQNRNLPHYFVPKMNLLAKIEPSDCEMVLQNINILKENMCSYLVEMSAAHGPFTIHACYLPKSSESETLGQKLT